MARKRLAAKAKRKQQKAEAAGEAEPGLPSQSLASYDKAEPASAVLALCPAAGLAAVAAGSCIHILQERDVGITETSTVNTGNGLRAAAFHPNAANILLSAGDAKELLVHHIIDQVTLKSLKTQKKISAATFTPDGRFMLVADKFGDVSVAAAPSVGVQPFPSESSSDPTQAGAGGSGEPPGRLTFLLGHFCSIITAMCVSPDGRLLATCDRDGKVRVSNLPPNLLLGAHEIQSFGLGHQGYVRSLAWVPRLEGSLLASGGSDGTVRLWEPMTGKQLALHRILQPDAKLPAEAGHASLAEHVSGPSQTQQVAEAMEEGGPVLLEAATEAAALLPEAVEASAHARGAAPAGDVSMAGDSEMDNDEHGQEDDMPVVLALASAAGGRQLAVVVEGSEQLLILECNRGGEGAGSSDPWHLHLQQELRPLQSALPTSIQYDAQSRLWVAGGQEDIAALPEIAILTQADATGLLEVEMHHMLASSKIGCQQIGADPLKVHQAGRHDLQKGKHTRSRAMQEHRHL
ncbi:hypothetical protein WJX84_006866 [Apatococcus fuscideae]|uniref:WD repeat-containing protein 4 homolog n=1 Tax=Apatococcus fuscideae TaxID=2026836 RepID=A0AAW1RV15_9CHLO